MSGNHRFAQRRDGNEPEIVRAIRDLGQSWIPINGKNLPDGIIGAYGHTIVAEIKQPGEDLRPDQAAEFAKWRGSPIRLIRTVDEVITLLRRYGAEPNR